MYQIIRITGRDGTAKADPEAREHLGCIGEAKMEENCVLFHCRYDRRGDPCDRYIRTSLVQSWKKDRGDHEQRLPPGPHQDDRIRPPPRRGGGAAFPYASTYRVTPKRRARRSLAA